MGNKDAGATVNADIQPIAEKLIRKVLTPERLAEFHAAALMGGLEICHDMNLNPQSYSLFGITPDNVGSLPNPATDPVAAWAVDHIGDMWEISAGYTAMRLGFVVLNEALKSEPVKKLTGGKEIQITDEACFWGSLVTTMTVVATHSLGMWAGPYNSHVGAPVPEMIFGQGVAAVVLAASHYAVKYREPIRDLALRAAGSINKKFKQIDQMMNNLGKPNDAPHVSVDG